MNITEAGCLVTMMLARKGTGKFSIKEVISNFVKVVREFYFLYRALEIKLIEPNWVYRVKFFSM